MRRLWLKLILVWGLIAPAVLAQPRSEQFNQSVLPFVAANCYVCHGAKRAFGEFNLAELDSAESIGTNREEWKLVLERVETGTMPPISLPARATPRGGIPSPSPIARQAFVQSLKSVF